MRGILVRARSTFATRAGVALLLPLVVVCVFFALHDLDPFGIGRGSAERSEQAMQRAIAPFYGPSRRVAVVLVDDDYLRDRGVGWPVSYAEQGRLLRQVLSTRPEVVVVDLVYPHRHSSNDEPGDLLRPIEGIADVPVVFTAMAHEGAALPRGYAFCSGSRARPAEGGGGLDAVLDPESIQPELRAQIAGAHAAGRDWHLSLVRWSGCGTRYPLLLGGDPSTPTPAFAGYRAWCARHADEPGCSAARGEAARTEFGEPMIVRWGAFPPPEQAFALGRDACQPMADAGGRVSWLRRIDLARQQLALGLFRDLGTHPNNAVRLPCPAVNVIPLSLLAAASPDEWRELLGGRLVVLGASISGLPDVVPSPVHGQVPGVVLHAMALDNLLQLGPAYLAERHARARTVLGFALVLLFAYAIPFLLDLLENQRLRRALAVTSFVLWIALALQCALLGEREAAIAALVLGAAFDLLRPTNAAVYFGAVLFAAAVSVFTLIEGLPPGNWLGIVLLMIAFLHTMKPFLRSSDRARLPHRHSILAWLWRRVSGAPESPPPSSAPHAQGG